MTPKIRVSELPDFDVAEYLEDDQAIAEYLTCVLEENDPNLLVAALGDIARARGMTAIARKAGLARESLYRSLGGGASPRLDTLMRVLDACGLKMEIKPQTAEHA